ncbi:duf1247 [Palpita vitrealis nucleopolyhedrovirus]|uniref:Duf1247 n=1 Tax=Palpita vitrealis nucleopolyhedrovirus TaxID=2951960 RepID=A0AAE9LNG0_9ABAC|nr:duf1247 [Palpita vitrealis nucleopolyhedrovirus]
MAAIVAKVPVPPPLVDLCNKRPIPTPRIVSLQQQLQTSVIKSYETYIQEAVIALKQLNITPGHLGEVLDIMGQQGKLLPEIIEADNDDFKIKQIRNLSLETIEYLNLLENDKLFRCRLCYTHAEWLWCDFHRNYAYCGARNLNCDNYVKHLNSDMGVVSLVEEYFFCLSSYNFKHEAKRVLQTLTKFESLSDLMASFNFTTENIDKNAYELMDFE